MDRIKLAIMAIIVVLIATAVLLPLAGWKVNPIITGSMEPAIAAGDLIVTAPWAPAGIVAGDIVLYADGNSLVAHRVIAVIPGTPPQFVMKGDANEGPDPVPVEAEKLAGKVVLNIPWAGRLSQFVRTPLGIVLTVVIPGLLLVGLELKKLLWEKT